MSSDGGFVLMYGRCINCGTLISFNPHKVPSIRVDGTREPLCLTCATAIYEKQVAAGLKPPAIPPDAYEPLPAGEI